MSSTLDILNSSGLLTIVTLSLGSVGLMLRYCFLSKCTHCKIFYGLIDIERDIDHELTEDHIDNNNKV